MMSRAADGDARAVRSRATLWAGRALSAVVALFMFTDAAIAIFAPGLLAKEQEAVGFPADSAPALGALMLICTLLYVVPRTAVIGAILLTGFLGGAICTHFGIGEVGSPPEIISLVLGVCAWLGLALRYEPIRLSLMMGITDQASIRRTP
jgi:hypothetical protein